MKIAAFDLATATGVCVGGVGEIPRLFSVDIAKPKAKVGYFLHDAMMKYGQIIAQEKPDIIYFEAPIIPKTTSIDTTERLQGLSGVIQMLAYASHIRANRKVGSEVKSMLTGYAGATGGDKSFQINGARALGMNPANGDEADAFSVWLLAVQEISPESFRAWEQRKLTTAWGENKNAAIRHAASIRAVRAAKKSEQSGSVQARTSVRVLPKRAGSRGSVRGDLL